ncbi:Centrosomal protein poc5, partial [Rhizophlyctis rosea]
MSSSFASEEDDSLDIPITLIEKAGETTPRCDTPPNFESAFAQFTEPDLSYKIDRTANTPDLIRFNSPARTPMPPPDLSLAESSKSEPQHPLPALPLAPSDTRTLDPSIRRKPETSSQGAKPSAERRDNAKSSRKPSLTSSMSRTHVQPAPKNHPKSSAAIPETVEKSSIPPSPQSPPSETDLTFDADPTGTAFSESLDKWTGMMRRAVLQDFLTAKQSLSDRHTLLIHHAKQESASEVTELTHQLAEAKAQISTHEAKMERRNKLVESALGVLDRKRARSTLTLSFARWRVKQAECKRVRLSCQLADRHYRRVQARQCLFGWQRVTGVSWRRTVEKRIQIGAEKTMEGMSVEYEKRISDLTNQLEETLTLLRKSELERAQAQEEMKKALMRGVCALNMEAMSMFRGGGGGGGVDPSSIANTHASAAPPTTTAGMMGMGIGIDSLNFGSGAAGFGD